MSSDRMTMMFGRGGSAAGAVEARSSTAKRPRVIRSGMGEVPRGWRTPYHTEAGGGRGRMPSPVLASEQQSEHNRPMRTPTILIAFALAGPVPGKERTERFDKDPGWDGQNNRATGEKRTIKQDFGYSRTAHAGA